MVKMSGTDEKYMQMALKLAQRGIGQVEPNPAVGAVIVKGGQVIGKGWHRKFGGPHAEINAIEDCKALEANPAGAAMYVTLEPCCHKSKTPPCTDAIIAAGLAKLIVATIDPSEHAAGKGIEQLRNAQIEVETGLCQIEARLLNAPFLKFADTGKTWVILKWAQTIDGKLSFAEPDEQKWISSEQSRNDSHNLRRRAGAILVGINTVITDDPLLTPRPAKGKTPLRIILDNQLRTPLDCQLIKTAEKAPVMIISRQGAVDADTRKAQAIRQKGAEILGYPDTGGRSNLHFLLEQLAQRGCQQLLVEGGAKVIGSFIKENLADEIVVYIAPKLLGGGRAVNIAESIAETTEGLELHNIEARQIGTDVRLSGLTKKALSVIENLSGTKYEKD